MTNICWIASVVNTSNSNSLGLQYIKNINTSKQSKQYSQSIIANGETNTSKNVERSTCLVAEFMDDSSLYSMTAD